MSKISSTIVTLTFALKIIKKISVRSCWINKLRKEKLFGDKLVLNISILSVENFPQARR